jgi:hypothetical protein
MQHLVPILKQCVEHLGISYHGDVPTLPHSDWIDEAQLQPVKDLARLKRPFLVRREPKI